MKPVLLALAALLASPAAAETVATESGPVAGTARTEAAGVAGWFGIPYAMPPVGPLRWKPPQPAPRWTGPRDATQFGPRCMQQPLYADMAFRSPGISEDCLTLNVWAPAKRAKAKLPVLLYIYGGGFAAGDASERRYDGANMAARGMVVVTVNYRLGVFGLLAHPALSKEAGGASGNYALMDQAAGLVWVRRNIAGFGGDPARITIAGESAGSMSVSALMAAPSTKGLIAGAIGESGALMAAAFPQRPLAQAEADGVRFADRFGAKDAAQLRAVPADLLLAGQGKGINFGPIVDGAFLKESVAETFAAGRQAKVPLLVGSNTQEGHWSAVLGNGVAPTLANWQAAQRMMYGPRADTVLGLYKAASDDEVPDAAMALASDLFLGQATWKWMDAQRRSGAPTYYYLYARPRPRALIDPAGTPPQPGAVHSAEIEYALGNLDVNAAYAWQPADRAVSATMSGYFANFVKSGNPNGAGLPRWPAASRDAARMERMRIDEASRAEPFAAIQGRHEAMEKIGAPDPQRTAQRPPITGVSHLAVYARDLKVSDRFYSFVLGAEKRPDPENPSGVRYYVNARQFVELLPEPPGLGKSRLAHVAYDTTDVAAMHAYLASLGGRPGAVQEGADGGRWFEIRDPEGNLVQFVQAPAKAKEVATRPISNRIIHVGHVVHDRAAEDRAYRDALGFRPYWFGGMQDNHADWISQQVPDGTEWIEYMMVGPGTGVPLDRLDASLHGVLDHVALGVVDMGVAAAILKREGRETPRQDGPKLGRDGKWQTNLYDPDGTRVELMEYSAREKPCCSPFTASDPVP